MLLRNREILIESIVFLLMTAAATAASLFFDGFRVILPVCLGFGVFHFTSAYLRYKKIRKLSEDLDRLLSEGISLRMQDYSEGELSILGVQIQKITLKLKEAAETVQRDKQFLADSLADISHQLRTPLTALNLTAAMLSSEETEEERRQELIQDMKQLLSRTQWLVEALLKFSRLDSETVKLEAKELEIKKLVLKAAELLRIPMDLRDQQLQVFCQGKITADPVWTAEALSNLLKNAMEHTPRGGLIRVTGEETPLFACITIEDTGSGFCPEDIPRLFERFYKGKNSTEASCGIGLALARSVITRQNGTIQAANTSNGAQFVIKFYKQTI